MTYVGFIVHKIIRFTRSLCEY